MFKCCKGNGNEAKKGQIVLPGSNVKDAAAATTTTSYIILNIGTFVAFTQNCIDYPALLKTNPNKNHVVLLRCCGIFLMMEEM